MRPFCKPIQDSVSFEADRVLSKPSEPFHVQTVALESQADQAPDLVSGRVVDRSTAKLTGPPSSVARDASAPEAILACLIEVCPFSIIVVGSFGKIVLANQETERMFGYSQDELIGQTVELLIPARLRTRHGRHRGQFAADHRSLLPRNLCGGRKDGTEFPAEVSINPIQTAEGILALGVIVDISERLRLEGLKDEFVATVSHELRTPLTSIAGALSLLINNAGGTLPELAKRLIKIANANSQRLVRLVNSILDMERIESGKVVFVQKRIEVRALVEEAIEANRVFADGFGVRIRLDPSSVSGDIRGDPDWLLQVVTNLLSNAVKFSPAAENVEVMIERPSGNIRISVRDHGHGVPQDFRPRIFEKFAQADASDARQLGGTGLGLSIVKQIVTRLGGEVGFDDAPGGGAVFHVEFPRLVQAAETLAEGGSADVPLRTNPTCSDD
jgi:PAS domain S-box-containing protein